MSSGREAEKARGTLSRLVDRFKRTGNRGDFASRDQAIRHADRVGVPVEDIADETGINERGIHRIIKNGPFSRKRKNKNRGDLGLD